MKATDQKIRIAIIVPRLEALGPVTVPVERLIIKKFRFTDYDIIHTNGIRPDLFGYLNRKKIKYHISTIHNFVFDDLAFTYNRLISLLFGSICLLLWKRADRLVCVSGAMKDYYKKWFSSAKMEVIHNGIPETTNYYKPDNDVIQSIDEFRLRGLKVIGCAGILTKRKGFDQVLQLIASEKELAAVIIGDGKAFSALRQLSEKLDISDRCKFFGFRNNAVVYFRYLDLFIIPSRSEGFGLVLIEAVQQKIPVICSDIDVFRELFTDDEVTYFKLEDIDSLSESVKTVIEKGFKKTKIAYDRFRKNYTALTMAEHYQRLYNSASVFQAE
jgi:glycosyltransferase involved in cell wall biosynthesis